MRARDGSMLKLMLDLRRPVAYYPDCVVPEFPSLEEWPDEVQLHDVFVPGARLG